MLAARDAWLKPGGSLWPSSARLFLAPARSHLAAARSAEFAASMAGWGAFQGEVDARYGVDVSALAPAYRAEQRLYYAETSAWADVAPGDLVGPASCIAELDLGTVTKADLEAPLVGAFRLPLEGEEEEEGEGAGGDASTPPVVVDAFVGWFDVTFAGSPANPAPHVVTLTTAPDAAGATHWGQQVPPLPARARRAGRRAGRRHHHRPPLRQPPPHERGPGVGGGGRVGPGQGGGRGAQGGVPGGVRKGESGGGAKWLQKVEREKEKKKHARGSRHTLLALHPKK